MAVGDPQLEHIESIVIDDVNTYYAMQTTSISTDYQHLHFRFTGGWNNTSGSTYAYAFLGSGGSVDYGSNYNRGVLYGYVDNGSYRRGYGDSSQSVGYFSEALTNTSHNTNAQAAVWGNILNYSDASKMTSINYHSYMMEDTSGVYHYFNQGWIHYKVTSAVNCMRLQATSASTYYKVGTRVDLWGYNT